MKTSVQLSSTRNVPSKTNYPMNIWGFGQKIDPTVRSLSEKLLISSAKLKELAQLRSSLKSTFRNAMRITDIYTNEFT